MTVSGTQDLVRRTAAAGALLFTIGLFSGLWVAASFTMRDGLAFPRLALAAHLNALLGGMWMITVAYTLPFLSYSERGLRRLVLGVALPSYANFAVTLVASFLDVRGLSYGVSLQNDLVAGALQALVVIPALVSATAWAWGFRRR